MNGAESFEFQVTAVRNYSGSWSYTWNNASRTASIDQSSVLSRGAAALTITDADGSVVYEAGNSFEHALIQIGHYPDKRSDAKGEDHAAEQRPDPHTRRLPRGRAVGPSAGFVPIRIATWMLSARGRESDPAAPFRIETC